MSAKGVQLVASIFSTMQEARVQLMNGDTQDILLGGMLGKGNDAIKGDFMKILDMKGWDIKHQPKSALKGP